MDSKSATSPTATAPAARKKRPARSRSKATPKRAPKSGDEPKPAAKRSRSKKAAPAAPVSPLALVTDEPKRVASRKQIDVKGLDADDARKRVAAIYKLESARDQAREGFEDMKRAMRAKRDLLKDAQAALDHEIEEQRFGPGPLFSPDGKGPAL